jgi:hypothetical protein
MSVDNFQQFVQTQQVQTQQVQTDNAAVKAIDAGIQSMGIREAFDARMNEMFEGFLNACQALGGKIKENLSKGVTYTAQKIDGHMEKASALPTPNLAQVKQMSPEITPSIPQPVLEQARAAVAMPALANVTHIENDAYVSPSHTPNMMGMGIQGQAMSI